MYRDSDNCRRAGREKLQRFNKGDDKWRMNRFPLSSQRRPAPDYGATAAAANPDLGDGMPRRRKVYGFCSIQTFCNQGGLSLTHDDALGASTMTSSSSRRPTSGIRTRASSPQYTMSSSTTGQDT